MIVITAKAYTAATPATQEEFLDWMATLNPPIIDVSDVEQVIVFDLEAQVVTYLLDGEGLRYMDDLNQGAARVVTRHAILSQPPDLIPAPPA